MKKINFMEKYPLMVLELSKNETDKKSTDEIIEYFRSKIEAHPVATFIAVFDHYGHTSGLKDKEMAKEIIDAKNIIFCFGKELLKPEVLGARPRSIGVAEFRDSFVVSFMEAPNPQANESIKGWVEELKRG